MAGGADRGGSGDRRPGDRPPVTVQYPHPDGPPERWDDSSWRIIGYVTTLAAVLMVASLTTMVKAVSRGRR
jgi:hypothetical protein